MHAPPAHAPLSPTGCSHARARLLPIQALYRVLLTKPMNAFETFVYLSQGRLMLDFQIMDHAYSAAELLHAEQPLMQGLAQHLAGARGARLAPAAPADPTPSSAL